MRNIPLLALFALAGLATAADILLVNGDSNRTTPQGGLSIGDKFVRDRLQAAGRGVAVVADSASRDSLERAASRCDAVLVLESVTSAKLAGKLKAVAKPILNCEAFIQDEMGLTATGPAGDPGAPDRFALGVLDNATDIRIAAPGHPLAAGLAGTVTVYTAPKEITWGKVGPEATVVATLASDTSGAALYVYEKGARLFDGTPAAGMRLGLFLEDDNTTGTPNLMTPQGLALFDRAVAYALGETPTFLHSARHPATPIPRNSHALRDLRGRATMASAPAPRHFQYPPPK
jgi:hypothetical protein